MSFELIPGHGYLTIRTLQLELGALNNLVLHLTLHLVVLFTLPARLTIPFVKIDIQEWKLFIAASFKVLALFLDFVVESPQVGDLEGVHEFRFVVIADRAYVVLVQVVGYALMAEYFDFAVVAHFGFFLNVTQSFAEVALDLIFVCEYDLDFFMILLTW